MVDLIAIKGAIEGLKSARDIAKAAIGLRDATLLQEKVIELNDAILSAQTSALDAREEQAALVEHIGELEQKLMRFETWETEKQRYRLDELPPGVFVYTLKPEMAEGENPHHICKTCYQRGQKAILDKSEEHNGRYHLRCNECGTDLMIGHWREPPVHRGGSWMRS